MLLIYNSPHACLQKSFLLNYSRPKLNMNMTLIKHFSALQREVLRSYFLDWASSWCNSFGHTNEFGQMKVGFAKADSFHSKETVSVKSRSLKSNVAKKFYGIRKRVESESHKFLFTCSTYQNYYIPL